MLFLRTLRRFVVNLPVAKRSCVAEHVRKVSSGAIELDRDEADWKNAEKELHSLLRIPSSGHSVFLIQPRVKWGPQKCVNSSPELRLAESISLVNTLPGWSVCDSVVVPLHDHGRGKGKLIGSGKMEEVRGKFQELKGSATRRPTAVFFSLDSLSPAQTKHLEDEFRLPVFDRYSVVLQIFRLHAKTREAKLQVSLAEIPLMRKNVAARIAACGSGEESWHLEKAKMRLGARETRLRARLDELKNHRDRIRKHRERNQIPVVAVVGYTNSGKTSLIKSLTGEERLRPKDQLFATLDVTVHPGRLERSGIEILLVDTVGFVSDVPIPLISSFTATLQDVLLADLIVHVEDVSNPDLPLQRDSVISTLRDLGLSDAMLDSMVTVHNKVDLLSPDDQPPNVLTSAIPASCKSGYNVRAVAEAVEERLLAARDLRLAEFSVAPGGTEHLWLRQNCSLVDEIDATLPGSARAVLRVSAFVSDVDRARMQKYCPQLLLRTVS